MVRIVFLRLLFLTATVANSFSNGNKPFRQQLRYNFYSSSESNSVELNQKETSKLICTNSDYRTVSVCYKEGADNLTIAEGGDCGTNAKVATGHYCNGVNETGWGFLEIETFKEFQPEIQAYAAGVVEGILTKNQIYYHYRNTVENMCKGYAKYCKKLYRYLSENLEWIRLQVINQPPTNLYWRQVNLTYTQLTGIFHGYSKQEYKPVVNYYITPILMLQLSGELFDLNKYLKKDPGIFIDVDPGHCSGFVKITEGNKDLLMSHVSMSGYNTMNRVLKLYKFAYDASEVPGHTYSFSGYPAVLASSDDYTLTSAGLFHKSGQKIWTCLDPIQQNELIGVNLNLAQNTRSYKHELSIETTISVFNNSRYTDEYIKPKNQLHCWVRSIVANQLAKTGEQWVKIFALYNSGTYNNQWTVLDYKLFKPGQELPENDVLWILEQIPGYTESSDVTSFLRKYRYWPSFNIPFLQTISSLSGFDEQAKKNKWYDWNECPRSRIFARDHAKVHDLETLKNLMRYNDYTHDEYSKCKCNPPYTAEAAISTRGDLNPVNGTYEISSMGHRNHGSLDYKGTNYELFQKLQIHAIGGPTYDPLPPFDWSKTDIVANHYGQPILWKFDPFIVKWKTPISVDMTPIKRVNNEGESNEQI